MPKAYGYIRVSTDEQHISPENQRGQIANYFTATVKPRGFDWGTNAEDIGVSGGKPFARRPAGMALQGLLQPGDAVIITKIDRGFRDTSDCLETARLWRKQGVELHLLDIGVDTGSAAGELTLTMLSGIAQFERGRIGERMREMYAWKKRMGIPCRAPWGFKLMRKSSHEKRKTILVPDKQLLACAEVVSRLRDEKGYSFADIARHCWEQRIKPAPNKDIGDDQAVIRLYNHYAKFREQQAKRAAETAKAAP